MDTVGVQSVSDGKMENQGQTSKQGAMGGSQHGEAGAQLGVEGREAGVEADRQLRHPAAEALCGGLCRGIAFAILLKTYVALQ